MVLVQSTLIPVSPNNSSCELTYMCESDVRLEVLGTVESK